MVNIAIIFLGWTIMTSQRTAGRFPKRAFRLARLCAAALLLISLAAGWPAHATQYPAATQYLDATDWIAALPSEPIEITSFPAYTGVTTDAFGTPSN